MTLVDYTRARENPKRCQESSRTVYVDVDYTAAGGVCTTPDVGTHRIEVLEHERDFRIVPQRSVRILNTGVRTTP